MSMFRTVSFWKHEAKRDIWKHQTLKVCLRKTSTVGAGILTDARPRVQSGWLWLLATEFIICSIHWSLWTRLQNGKKKKSVHNVAVYRDPDANERQNESGKRSTWKHSRTLLTARSSSSELNRLSRSLMDTTKSVSWMRLVEAILL